MTPHHWTVILLATIQVINAQPKCTIFNDKDVVCTATSPYVLRRGLVSDRNSTTGITLRNCLITDIDFESFDGLPSLTYLDLSQNHISRLRLGVLDEFTELRYLNLSYNLLIELPLGLFDQKPNIEVLDLRGNRINDLELGIFDPFLNLRHLDLSNNALTGKKFNTFLFDQTRKITFIDFSRNNMEDSSENLLHAFTDLDFLNLDRCALTEVPKFALSTNLKSMKHLMLSTNLITKVDDPMLFKNLENLEIINLAYNSIETIHENVFKTAMNLKMIVLNNNNLKELPDTLFQNMKRLGNVNLSYNLIEFVPVNAFRGSGIKNLNLAGNRFSYLTDNFLLELRNTGTKINKFFFNQNPWQCACLIQVLNEAKIMNVEYNKVKFNGKAVVCVTKEEFSCKRHQIENEDFVNLYFSSIHI